MKAHLTQIPKSTIYKLCSGQVIIDIGTAIKEIIENSLDAGANVVEVKIKNYGLESIIITDNGSGIESENFEALCRKNWTSKLEAFEDLTRIGSFGFRGEALSSLCSVASVTVITATEDTKPMGAMLEYDEKGELKSQKPIARERGTTVILRNLFKNWPVRYQEFKRNHKKDFAKCIWQVEQYAIISDGLQISLYNQTNNSGLGLILRTQKTSTMLEKINSLFGKGIRDKMLEINEFREDKERAGIRFEFNGYISSPVPGCGRSSSDKQYLYLNGKPCEIPKMKRVMNEVYREYNPVQYPMAILNIKLNPGTVDFNVSPDKRSVFIQYEQELADILHDVLKKAFIPTKASISLSTTQALNKQLSVMEFIPTSKELQPNNTVQVDEQEKTAGLQGDQQRVSKNIEKVNVPDSGQPNNNERARDGTSTKESNAAPDLGSSVNHGNMMQTSPIRNSAVQNEANSSGYNATLRDFVTVDEPRPTRVPIRDNEVQNQTKRIEQDIRSTPEGSARKSMVNLGERSKTNPFRSPATPDVKAASDTPKKVPLPATRCLCLNRSLTATVSMSEIVEGVLNHGNQMDLDSDFVLGGDGDKDGDKDTTGSLGVAGVKNLDNDSAALSLSTILKKEDFGRMQVVGQFNLGFVVAKLDDDLFIVDQHASDEKSNFEELQLKSVISSQPLIRPLNLELSIADEQTAFEHQDLLAKNGFLIKENHEATPGNRIQLLSQPVIGNVIFSAEDFKELLLKIQHNPSESTRCSRARRVFASRACRKSIMIGDGLNHGQMKKILSRLGELKHPWNCPHGRPTLRHLHRIECPNPSSRKFKWNGSIFS